MFNIMRINISQILLKTNVVSWILVCIGWIVSNHINHSYWSKEYSEGRREQVFEEVSVLIEKGQILSDVPMKSYSNKEPPFKREGLWRQYEELEYKYYGSRSRYQYLLDKYFGVDIAVNVDRILYSLFPGVSREEGEEKSSFLKI